MRSVWQSLMILFVVVTTSYSQSSPAQLEPIMAQRIQTVDIAAWLLRSYGMARIPPAVSPRTPEQWTEETNRRRQHLLNDIVFHGWPKEWVRSQPHFEEVGVVDSGDGYRIRKLRYEIVPGFESSALLYEPDPVRDKMPAILNVCGHGPPGKSVEYIQKQSINFAKMGILTLTPEWLKFGDLARPGNDHEFAAHLDLVGANGEGLFYLAMRRGLDYLYQHPHVDTTRLGMTGLSGGGWQTIMLSSLDERVLTAVPVAGYGSITSIMERPGGDHLEELPTDFFVSFDYSQLTAMRAPRPTLLIYNAEDDCCWRASLVKPYIFDQVRPFFKLFGAEDAFGWYENMDPGTHNYQIDNRQHAYQFFAKYFKLSPISSETPVDNRIKGNDELRVSLPDSNLTILGLAKILMNRDRPLPTRLAATNGPESVVEQRAKLRDVVRYHPVDINHPWAVANTKNKGVETRSYLFEMSNKLSATGVWVKAITTPENAPITIVLDDKGRKDATTRTSDAVNRGEQVLALDPLFFGDAAPEDPGPEEYVHMINTLGDRAIGVEAAQLIGISRWLQRLSGARRIRIDSDGIRSQVIALLAAAIEPGLFSQIVTHHGMRSLSFLLENPVRYEDAPDLFCLDLYKTVDIDQLIVLAGATNVDQQQLEQTSAK